MDSELNAPRISRRAWTLLLGAIPLLGHGQVTSSVPPQTAAAPAQDTPEQKLEKAYAEVRKVSQRLAETEVPMDVEPSFSFHV